MDKMSGSSASGASSATSSGGDDPTDERAKTPGPKTPSQTTSGHDVSLPEDLMVYKVTLESLDGATYVSQVPSYLCTIHTDLHLSAGGSDRVNQQHDVWQLETASSMKSLHDVLIKCRAVFKTLPPDGDTPSSRVLTNGIAGIGKTFNVRKFALDWARGLENQDIDLLVPFSFRELNLVRDEQHSLLSLIHVFHPTLKKVTAEQLAAWKVGFILDGLDESRFPLKFENIDVDSDDFDNNDVISDVTVTSSVGLLLTNIIKKNLLPSALFWITSRPAAANQIPPECVDMVTEMRGFTDPQRVEFFRKMFSDDRKLASTIISHVKTSKSIHLMCHIPVICWMTATVVEDLVKTGKRGQLPKSLTGMLSHFVSLQLRSTKCGETQGVKRKEKKKKRNKKERIREKKKRETDVDVVVDDVVVDEVVVVLEGNALLKLGQLAFDHLEKGTVTFYQEDLEECGLDVDHAALCSGVCAEIFKEETVQSQRKIYSFVHPSIQEFLAAVYLFHCFTQENMEAVKTFLGVDVSSLEDLLLRAIGKALRSKNGHLDLFVRFLHGLTLESNQSLLGGLLGHTENSPEETQRVINNLKEMKNENGSLSPDRFINISHCLMEMNDLSVHQEIQRYLKSTDRSKTELSESQASALAFTLLTSEEVLEELDLHHYNTTTWGKNCLISAVRNSRKARLVGCDIQKPECEIVASALSANPSHLRELDLSYNDLKDPSGDFIANALMNPNCHLEVLRLAGCIFTLGTGLEIVLSALSTNLLHLRELDLSFISLQEVPLLLLCGLLQSPQSRLQIVRLSGCGITEKGCSYLLEAVTTNPSSRLKQLDLNFSHLQGYALRRLTAVLETVNVNNAGEHWTKPQLLTTHFQRLTLDTNTAHITLSLSENNRTVTRDDRVNSYPDHPDRFDVSPQVLSAESLGERCYGEMEFSGTVQIGLTDRDIRRIGQGHACCLGETTRSWSLFCSHYYYSVIHDSKETALPIRPSGSNRVGVHLDRPAGTLSFYRVLGDTLTHLYTFQTTFPKRLHAAFKVYHGASVSLCEDPQGGRRDRPTVRTDRQAVGTDRQAVGTDRQAVGTDRQAVGTDRQAVGTDRQAVGTEECVVS